MTENGNSMIMPVTPYGGNGGFGGFGGDWGWIILLLLFAGGGWGGGFGMDSVYPWMNQANLTSNGFQNQLMNDNVTSIQNSANNIATQLCNGFAGVNSTVANGFAQSEIADNSRQMANMNQAFSLSQQLSQCCCDNRLATCQTQNIIQNEANQTRYADLNNTRDIMENCNRNNQAILDKLCNLELDQYKRENDNLRSMVNMQALAASQSEQTARLIADNTAQTQYIVNRVAPYPIPSYTVPNPFPATVR